MFLVLTAAAGISEDIVAAAMAQLPAPEAPRRLSACAVDIRFRGARPDFAPVAGIDANFVPVDNRRKKLLIADMDSTIIPVECIDELADFAGVLPEVSAITEIAMRGEMGFEQSLIQRVALLAGLDESALERCYIERISLNPGARILVQTMNNLDAMTALVSGGFTYFTEKVATDSGFQMNRANVLNLENGVLTGKVKMPILGRESKQTALNEICVMRGITAQDVIAVGDGANDLRMIEAAGLGVAYRAKETLKASADAVLDHSDLTALLALQGISEAEYQS